MLTLSVVTASASCSQKHQTVCLSVTKELSVLQISGCFKTLPRCHSMFPVTETFCPLGCIWCYKYKVHGQIIILIFLFNKERISHVPYKKRDCTVVPKPGLSLLPPAYSSWRMPLSQYLLLLPREGLTLEGSVGSVMLLLRHAITSMVQGELPWAFLAAPQWPPGEEQELPEWLQLFPKLMPPGFR